MVQKQKNSTTQFKKIKKLTNKPYVFFEDSRFSVFRWLRHFFIDHSKPLNFYTKFLVKISKSKFFVGFVAFPTILTAIYLIFIASPRYETFTKIVIKGDDSSQLMQPIPLIAETSSSRVDLALVEQYITSYDILQKLDHELDLRNHYYDSPDYLSSLKLKNDQKFYEYYNNRLRIEFDETATIMTIYYDDFSANRSYDTLSKILQLSQDHINSIFDKIYDKEVSFARENMETILDKITDKRSKLFALQADNSTISPHQDFAILSATLTELESGLLKEKAKLSDLSSYLRPSSLQVKFAKKKVENLEREILVQRQNLIEKTSKEDKEDVVQIENMEMEIKLLFAQYETSLVSLQKAKMDMLKELKHIIVISEPFIAQERTYPKRIYNIILFFILNYMLYFIVRLIYANVVEHKEIYKNDN